MVGVAMHVALAWVVGDTVTNLRNAATVAQAFAGILTGLIAVLGVPLALRQVVNLQRELRIYETETHRRLDAESNLNITTSYSLSHVAREYELTPEESHPGARRTIAPRPMRAVDGREAEVSSTQPTPPPEFGKRVLRLDITLENVGEGSVDILGCLVAARELVEQGREVIEHGRDAQWDDLTTHYWDGDEHCLSPGLSTTKHTVYAQDALARVKAHSRKALARIDQLRERAEAGDIYLLYRIFVVARRSSRSVESVQSWTALQRALLNVNSPAFREASHEQDPLGLVATPDGWRLFLLYYETLADTKLPQLRTAATREEAQYTDAAAYAEAHARLDAELQAYCEKMLLPAWRRYKSDYERMLKHPEGFVALLADKRMRRRQRVVERRFPWEEQEVWTEYSYVTLERE